MVYVFVAYPFDARHIETRDLLIVHFTLLT